MIWICTWYLKKKQLPYYIIKIDIDSTRDNDTKEDLEYYSAKNGHMLCSMSKKSNGCCANNTDDPRNPYYGGHVDLPQGSIYMMYGIGAWGGPTHAIHSTKRYQNYKND